MKKPSSFLLLFLAAVVGAWLVFASPFLEKTRPLAAVSNELLASSLKAPLEQGLFPREIFLPMGSEIIRATTRFSIDLPSQVMMEKLVESYKPDYGAFVAVDATDGRIISMVSYTRDPLSRERWGNLALRASFPAASVFKIVTAAAAVDQKRADADTVIPFNGSNHTLYKRNVTSLQLNRWTRQMTLGEAFAKSVNTVFAKIGLYYLEPSMLEDYAERFLFNRSVVSDIPVDNGLFLVPEHSQWSMAEVSSGFNQKVLMSPVQGALIAAAVANDGVMMEPYLVDSLESDTGEVLYQGGKQSLSVTMSPTTAAELRRMMRRTVEAGTSRKAFRDLSRQKKMVEVEIGGKTGSLRGSMPEGKYDWFVGYAIDRDRKIAVAALTINIDQWRVKSSYLARRFMESYLKKPVIRETATVSPLDR